MNPNILRSLFYDNPGLSDAWADYCRNFPGYEETQQEFKSLMDELKRVMGDPWLLQFEEALNRCLVVEDKASYFFGLGVRQETLQALAAGYSTPR